MSFFKVFRIMGLLTTWMEHALLDGVIDRDEMVELVTTVLDIAGVKAEIKVDME